MQNHCLEPVAMGDCSSFANGDPQLRGSTLGDLLQFAGTWEGDDIRECLQLVRQDRSRS